MLENADAAMNRALEANKKEVSEITTVIFRDSQIQKEDATCVICLDEYEPDDELRILRCGHHYHKECVDQWLIEKGSCCLCHQGLSTGVNMYGDHLSVDVGPAPPTEEVQLAESPAIRPAEGQRDSQTGALVDLQAQSSVPVPAPPAQNHNIDDLRSPLLLSPNGLYQDRLRRVD